jgi:hypothetical protein
VSFLSVFFILGAVTVVATLFSLRREHIRTEYSISWLLVGFMLAVLALAPRVTEVAQKLGIDSNLFLPIAGGVLISMLVFEISHAVSKLRDENVMLAQRVAILEYQLRQIEEQRGARGN